MADPQYADNDCGHGARQAPLVAGAALGLRAFRIDPGGWLRGITYQQRWTPGENVARCYVTERAAAPVDPPEGAIIVGGVAFPHDDVGEAFAVPGYRLVPCTGMEPECACGFYAYHEPTRSRYGAGGSLGCTGLVEGYGRVVVGPYGYRAQKARVVALVLPKPDPALDRQMELLQDAIAAGRRMIQNLTVGALHVGRNPRRILGLAAVVAAAVTVQPVLMPAGVLLLGSIGAAAVLAEWQDRAFLRVTREQVWKSIAGCERTLVQLVDQATEGYRLTQKVRRNYPGVPVYATEADMLAAHPLESLGHLVPPQVGAKEEA